MTTALRTAALASDAYAPTQPPLRVARRPPKLADSGVLGLCRGRHALLAAVDEAIRLGLTEEAQTGQARLRKMAYQ